VRFDKMSTSEVVAALDSANGWQRDKAQQVLLWRGDTAAVAPLRELAERSTNPLARLHALCALDGLGKLEPAIVARALSDAVPGVRENALRLAETRFTAEVLTAAVRLADDPDAKVRLQLAFSLGASPDALAGETLARLLKANASDPMMVAAVMSSATPHLRALAGVGGDALLNTALGVGDRAALAQLLAPTFTPSGALYAPTQLASFARLLDLLAQHNSSLEKLRGSSTSDALTGVLAKAEAIFTQARSTATEASAPAADRIAAASLLSRVAVSRAEAIKLLSAWLEPQHPAEVQAAALRALGETGAAEVPGVLAQAWATFSPVTRQAALSVWMSREAWAFDLMRRIEHAELPTSAVDTLQRARLLKHDSARVRQLATTLFSASTTATRGKVVDAYRPALSLKGDAAKGRETYLRTCAVCHKRGPDGKDIGPDLISVVEHPPEKLLASILDPNADIQPGFNAYTCTLKSGEQIYGLVAAETANSVTMKLPDASQKTVLRNQIASLQSQNLSLMPEGLEAALTPQDVADLITFLRQPLR
jgi:putative heme-binding domain-containing protein